ncbi:MAG: hypothetical protein LUP91_15655, partial [Methylococcaceae bacterium]|nr:hypothetical protein [Methylococcaceae bacterium]
MENFATRDRTTPPPRRRTNAGGWLLAASLLAFSIVPAWAEPKISAGMASNPAQASEAGIIAVIYPDVGDP